MADPMAKLLQAATSMFKGTPTPAENGPAPTPQEESTQPKTADPYADTSAILSLVKKYRDEWGKRGLREPHLRAAYRNILFMRGVQWIRWDRMGGRWRPATIPRDIPTPVTNKFASTLDAVISVFARIEPQLNFSPGSPDEPDDRAAANVAVRAIQVIEDEVKIRVNRQMLAAWVGLTGGCFLETGYDPDQRHGMRTVPVEQCPSCQTMQAPGEPLCTDCGQPGPFQPATQQVPVGKMFVDVVPLFEMYFDPSITDFDKHRILIREKAISVEEAKERWPDVADQIIPNVTGSQDEWYMASLATLGPALDDRDSGRRNQFAPLQLANRVTEQWFWSLPNSTYPQGLLAIVLGNTLVTYAKPLPYTRMVQHGDPQPFLPFTWFPQKLVPGTFWPKTVADDIAFKQSQRNRFESAIELCAMRMGMPIWMVPKGSNAEGLAAGGGNAGAIVKYNAMGPANAKPERIPGQGLPLSFIQFLELTDKAFEELAATFDVIKGSRPEGVSAGIALQILQERGMSRYGPLFIIWETAWSEWARQALEIFRQFATEERLLRIQGRDGRWDVQKFVGADLQGRVDVIPEAGSSMPRSSLLDRAEMEQLVAQGIINPRDPETQFKFLEVYGRTSLLPSMKLDTKNAIMEDEVFEQIAQWPGWQNASPADSADLSMVQTYPEAIVIMNQWSAMTGAPMFPWPEVSAALDGHAIHSREHGNYGKTETYRAFPKVVQAMFEKHKAYHDQLLIQQMAAVQGGPQSQIQGGFLQPSPGGAMPMQQTLNTSSSGARMQGDGNEMAHDVAAGGL